MRLVQHILVSTLLIFTQQLWAAEGQSAPTGLQPVPDGAPAPPPKVKSGEPLEQEVTIREKKDAKIEEYRISGKLYMVKVTPVIGPPYYLVDNNGDGQMETRITNPDMAVIVPQWVLLSW